MRILLSLVAISGLAISGLAGTARAECRQDDVTKPVSAKVEMIDGKRTIVIQQDIVVCGHPPRPAVAYVTSAEQVDYAWQSLEQHLAPKIVDSVKQIAPSGGRR